MLGLTKKLTKLTKWSQIVGRKQVDAIKQLATVVPINRFLLTHSFITELFPVMDLAEVDTRRLIL